MIKRLNGCYFFKLRWLLNWFYPSMMYDNTNPTGHREPSVLVHADSNETDSVSDAVAAKPTVVGFTSVEGSSEITALACHPGGEYVFCGKGDGTIALYSTATGDEVQALYQHAQGIAIAVLIYGSKANVLVSADTSSRFMVRKVRNKGKDWAIESPLLDARVPDYSVHQVLLDLDNKRLLVSTMVSDTVYNIHSGVRTAVTFKERSSWKWVNHPQDPQKLIHITAKAAHTHIWDDLSEPHSTMDMKLASDMSIDMSVKDVAACSDGCKLSVEFSKSRNGQSTSHVQILSASSFEEPLANTIESLPLFATMASSIEHLIGSVGTSLLFLDRRMWVCSLNLERFAGEYYQHCFIPDEWLSANWNLILKVTGKGDLIFVKKNEIAVIKGALNHKEAVKIDPL